MKKDDNNKNTRTNPAAAAETSPGSPSGNHQPGAVRPSPQERRMRNKKKRIRAVLLGIVFLLLIASVILFATGGYHKLFSWMGIQQSTYYNTKSSILEFKPIGEYSAVAFRNTILVCDENGVTGLDKSGKWKWNVALSFLAPDMEVNQEYVLLTDIGGNAIYAFGEDGRLWQKNFSDALISGSASKDGNKVAVLHHTDSAYQSALTLLDIKKEEQELFTRKFGSYYMVRAVFAPDGNQMAISGMYSDGGEVQAVIQFLRMKDGEAYTTKTYEAEFYPIINYLKGSNLFAASTDSLRHIVCAASASTDKDKDDALWQRNAESTILRCTAPMDNKYIVAVYGENNGELMSDNIVCTVCVYDESGKKGFEFKVEGKITGVRALSDQIVLFTENKVMLYNRRGICIGEYTGMYDITDVEWVKTRELLICGNEIAFVKFE